MKHALAILALGVLAGCDGLKYAESPPMTSPRYVYIWTDPGTGCDYIGSWDGGITPRLNPDGTQVCTQKDESND